jgi:hypothetical protein
MEIIHTAGNYSVLYCPLLLTYHIQHNGEFLMQEKKHYVQQKTVAFFYRDKAIKYAEKLANEVGQ